MDNHFEDQEKICRMNKELKYDSKKISYSIYGQGKPVMLVHGFGEDSRIWKHQVEYLQNNFKLIVPDLPGSGKSELIPDLTIDEMAEVLHAIIHEENIERCTVIGHSMGGYTTLALAEKYWNHLNAFGLFHSSAFADSEEKKAARQKSIHFIKEHGAMEFLKTAIPNLFSEQFREKSSAIVEELIKQGHNFSAESLVSYYQAMIKRPDRSSVLSQSAVSVLFIMGKYDTAVPFEDSLKQCHLPETSYIHILQQSAHMGMLEETEKCNEILEKFLQEI